MPRVPEYESQVSRETPAIRTPTVGTMPRAAFGGQEAAADARAAAAKAGLGAAISQAGQALSGIAERGMKMHAEKEAMKLATEFQTNLDDMLYSTANEDVLDDSENVISRPRGILNQKKGQVKDAMKRFDGSYAESLKGFDDRLGSGYEREVFNRMTQGHYRSARNAVNRHQAKEERAEYKAVMDAGLERITQAAAAYTNAADLQDGIGRAIMINETGMRSLGEVEDEIEVRNDKLAGEIATVAVSTMLENEPLRAQAMFEAIKESLPKGHVKEIERIIKGKTFADDRIAVWDSLSGAYRRADGSYDREALRAKVMDLPGFNTVEKEKLVSYTEARADDSESAYRKGNAANDKAFLNEVITKHESGASLDDLLKMAAKYGRDPADIRQKENAVRRMLDTTKTDPETYLNTYEGIRNGEITAEQLELIKLSGPDYLQFKKMLIHDIEKPESSIKHRSVWKIIKDMAARKYSNVRSRNEYLTELMRGFRAAGGGTPEQLLAKAYDDLEKVKTSWTQIFGGQPKWKISAEKHQEAALLKGRLETSLGSDLTDEIMHAIGVGTGKDEPDAADVNQFVEGVGGMEVLQAGTPAYKAIQELVKYKRLVTAEAVQFVISKHPEWQ